MTEQRVQRRLAAILAADVVGYSALMQRAEEATYAEFERLKCEVIEPGLARHGGRLIKTTGDGALAEFASPSAAVQCAVEIQEGIASGRSSLNLRIGINLGEVIVGADGDLFGDGINIAVRLEGGADPGGILISEKVYSEIEGKLDVGFEDRGEQQFKNISKPVRAYAVRADRVGALREELSAVPRLPDKPSIAVLPFQNMSGDPDQEYFADGMVEEIITELSRFKNLFVISRNSSFTYKGTAVDIKKVGSELGVRYVLEGSVRKSGQRLRITGQLIDAKTGTHLWADKFEGQLLDAFDLQDKIAVSVVGAIAPRLLDAEIERAKRKPPESWDAYDYYLRGLALYAQHTAEASEEALPLFRRAIQLNPEFGLAHMRVASCLFWRPQHGGLPLTNDERAEVLQLNDRALALEPKNAFVLSWAALFITYLAGDIKRGSEYADRALAINPNLSSAWNVRGWISLSIAEVAEVERGLEAFNRAIRLNPFDDWTVFISMRGRVCALWGLGRDEEAVEETKKLLARAPNDLYAWLFRWIIEGDPTIRVQFPKLRSSDLKRIFVEPTRNFMHRARLEEAIDRLGLPE
ncbi:adenylate/guanylate cyclase domain-containing protein [Bradyrhizobium sp. CCBAU 45394]|uniref:adenylate/guanylate cyclase domain-containing protein n=1 Tax=Bradyrhizobium sp. CCBAU 45394 TaxID=1325087 RepID=UPI002304852A|nr:adenylate/guanylate cyclase domain-containing protein [Bradyrhizobium sp. CCBAU 45394]